MQSFLQLEYELYVVMMNWWLSQTFHSSLGGPVFWQWKYSVRWRKVDAFVGSSKLPRSDKDQTTDHTGGILWTYRTRATICRPTSSSTHQSLLIIGRLLPSFLFDTLFWWRYWN